MTLKPVVFLDRQSPPHMITMVFATSVAAMASNLFLPSLPGMMKDFDTDYSVVQLTVSLFLATQAVLQLVLGPASDRFGRRPVMLVSFAIFVVSSLLSVFAPTMELLLACRMFQAFSVAGMVLSRAIVRDMVSPSEAASRLGYIITATMITPMIGPMIGGILDELYGWRATFIVTGLFGVVAMCFVYFDLGETHTTRSSSFAAQARTYPELFRSRTFWGYSATAAFGAGSFFSFMGGAPYVATQVMGMSPTLYGIYFGCTGLGYAIGNFIAGRYSRQWGIFRMMKIGSSIGLISMSIGFALFLVGFDGPITLFLTASVLSIGSGLIQPNAMAGIVSVKPQLAGLASGLSGAMLIGFGAFLSTVVSMFLSPETGAYPLLILMLFCAIGTVASTIYVIRISPPTDIAR